MFSVEDVLTYFHLENQQSMSFHQTFACDSPLNWFIEYYYLALLKNIKRLMAFREGDEYLCLTNVSQSPHSVLLPPHTHTHTHSSLTPQCMNLHSQLQCWVTDEQWCRYSEQGLTVGPIQQSEHSTTVNTHTHTRAAVPQGFGGPARSPSGDLYSQLHRDYPAAPAQACQPL